MVKLKRIYQAYDENDGYRILVDRLWPRGILKEKAYLDMWLKDIAPSTELRKWFDHDLEKWESFQEKYRAELINNEEPLLILKRLKIEHSVITLLYGAKDELHNEAIVLLELLKD